MIYGQTDSTFLHLPDATAEEAVGIAHAAASLISAAFPPEMSIKCERILSPFLLLHVNRYAGAPTLTFKACQKCAENPLLRQLALQYRYSTFREGECRSSDQA